LSEVKKVVLLHGVWSHGAALTLFKRHLEKEYDFDVSIFNYRSMQRTLDENADALASFMHEKKLNDSHLVGHSLGGIILLRMLANESTEIAGRVVCMGSPLRGSRAATVLNTTEWGDAILGRSLATGVVKNTANEWAHNVCEKYDVGIIAGDAPYGFGQFFAKFDGPNDGTVAVAETQLDGRKDHIVLPTSHKGLVFTNAPADQAASFLKRGEFLRGEK
jgi:pimeloyl-ACP methyl ester carboxylesterase